MQKQRIGLTMGDPAGVGPELVLRALNNLQFFEANQLVVFGNNQILQRCSQELKLPIPACHIMSPSDFTNHTVLPASEPITIVSDETLRAGDLVVGRTSPAYGQAAYSYIDQAINAALSGRVNAVTTAPINKESLHVAGHKYPGHTEIFAERASSPRWCMMQYSEKITCTFVTVHCGYKDVPTLLTQQGILDTIELTDEAIRRIRGRAARILVCGLNPHAGENGLFGDREEERLIEPAIAIAKTRGINVDGPFPPDTVFIPNKLASCDAIVCMYHDQGHIPVKALAFEEAVNTTLGLRIVRTSVDHGTAFDIAWKGIAKPDSLFAALRLAAKLAS
ncbi:MAG: 4-hydroxythreonine-4-phosphate dehydrogenase PdxA [Pirellulales bacterium]